jgi:hypothetical protein
MPRRANASLHEMKLARWIEQVRHEPQSVSFALEIVVPDILSHDSLRLCIAPKQPFRISS